MPPVPIDSQPTRREFVATTATLAGAAKAAPSSQSTPRLVLAYRVSPAHWTTDREFQRLLDTLALHRRGADEVCLFDGGLVRPTAAAADSFQQACATWTRRMAQLRQAGYRAGINVFWTIGHQDMPGMPDVPIPYQPMIGHDGQVADSCACPNDAAYRDFLSRKYHLAASAKPDFIWVDDDFRNSHHGPTYPCFCPLCLRKFGRGGDRVALVRDLDAPANAALRRQWSDFCAQSLEEIAALIGRTVRETDPAIELGLMTIGYSHSTYGGYRFPAWMRALGACRARPGHGFYTDEKPRDLTAKILDVGRQIRDYPPEAAHIQYELENYPYIELDKASQTVLNECTLALMMGCTGIAFNALKECEGSLDDYHPLLRAIAAQRPTWEFLRESVAGLSVAGVWPADTPDLMANRAVGESGWFREGGLYDIQRPNELGAVGIPLSPDRRGACGTVLAGNVADGFSTVELRAMLSAGVLLDGFALQVLWTRGLGEFTGVRPGEEFLASVTERLTGHRLNGNDHGEGREALVGPSDHVFRLDPIAPEVETLSSLVRYDGKPCGSCFTVFQNRLGGRVAVSTYSPWRRLGRGAKRRQLMAVTDWLAGGRLPVLIQQNVRVAPWIRFDAERRRFTLVLFNMALDPTGPLTLRVRAAASSTARLASPHGHRALPTRRNSGEITVEVPSIPAWNTTIVTGA